MSDEKPSQSSVSVVEASAADRLLAAAQLAQADGWRVSLRIERFGQVRTMDSAESREIWRDKGTGTLYEYAGSARLAGNQTPLELYQSIAEGDDRIWVVTTDEFYSGRFERISGPGRGPVRLMEDGRTESLDAP